MGTVKDQWFPGTVVEGGMGGAQRILKAVTLFSVTIMTDTAITYWLKPTECTTVRVKPDVNYGFWVMCHVDSSLVTNVPLCRGADKGSGYACGGAVGIWKSLYLPSILL